MKKRFIAISSVIIVALLAGAIYVVSSHKKATKIPRTKEDQLVAFHEARVANQPDDSEAYRRLAAALMLRAEATGDGADYDSALKALDQAIAFAPGAVEIMQARATVLMSRHQFREAGKVAEQALVKVPENPELVALAGDGALQSGDLDTAEKYYQHLVKLQPAQAGSWSRLSQLAEMRGNLEEAAKLMEKAIDAGYPRPLSPTNIAWARAILGEIEGKRGNVNEARRQYRWALAKSPGHPLAMEFLADLELWQGNIQEAETSYRELLAKKPTANIQIKLANLLDKRGEKDEAGRLRAEARSFYEQAVASGNEGYLRPLATLELSAGNYRRAAELAARDMNLRPTPESRAIYANIVKAANEAGQSLDVAKNN